MLTWLLRRLIRGYQLTISPCLGDCCRFEPSCSRYADLCLEHHGAVRGTWLSAKRILRCNPFFRGGLDLPPLPAGVAPELAEPDWQRLDRRLGWAFAPAAPTLPLVPSARAQARPVPDHATDPVGLDRSNS